MTWNRRRSRSRPTSAPKHRCRTIAGSPPSPTTSRPTPHFPTRRSSLGSTTAPATPSTPAPIAGAPDTSRSEPAPDRSEGARSPYRSERVIVGGVGAMVSWAEPSTRTESAGLADWVDPFLTRPVSAAECRRSASLQSGHAQSDRFARPLSPSLPMTLIPDLAERTDHWSSAPIYVSASNRATHKCVARLSASASSAEARRVVRSDHFFSATV